jgi:hypothetical protein
MLGSDLEVEALLEIQTESVDQGDTVKPQFTYSSIYVLLIYVLFFRYYPKYVLKFDLRTLLNVLKFDIHTSLNRLKFNIRTLSTLSKVHISNLSTLSKVRILNSSMYLE